MLSTERKNKDVEHIREKRRVLADLQDTWISCHSFERIVQEYAEVCLFLVWSVFSG